MSIFFVTKTGLFVVTLRLNCLDARGIILPRIMNFLTFFPHVDPSALKPHLPSSTPFMCGSMWQLFHSGRWRHRVPSQCLPCAETGAPGHAAPARSHQKRVPAPRKVPLPLQMPSRPGRGPRQGKPGGVDGLCRRQSDCWRLAEFHHRQGDAPQH